MQVPSPAKAGGALADQVRVAVLGASGYTGEEVVRLLALHPTFKVTALTGDRQAGKVRLGRRCSAASCCKGGGGRRQGGWDERWPPPPQPATARRGRCSGAPRPTLALPCIALSRGAPTSCPHQPHPLRLSCAAHLHLPSAPCSCCAALARSLPPPPGVL